MVRNDRINKSFPLNSALEFVCLVINLRFRFSLFPPSIHLFTKIINRSGTHGRERRWEERGERNRRKKRMGGETSGRGKVSTVKFSYDESQKKTNFQKKKQKQNNCFPFPFTFSIISSTQNCFLLKIILMIILNFTKREREVERRRRRRTNGEREK